MNLLELRILGICGAITALLIGYGIWHHHVYQEGQADCKAAQVKAIEKGDKKYEKAIPKNKTRSDADLRKSVCLGVWDTDYDSCVKSLPDFIP